MRILPKRLTRHSLIALVLATEAILILLALLISLVFPVALEDLLGGGEPIGVQILVGLAASGVLFGAVAVVVWLFPAVMDSAGRLLHDLIRQTRPTMGDCALISAGAGLGEELLFRAVLYPLLGPFGSAALFAFAHAFNAETWGGRFLYVVATFTVGLFLGWLFIAFGLLAAIVCHAVYDFIALEALRRDVFPTRRRTPSRAS